MNRKRDLYLIAEAYKEINDLKISGKDFKLIVPEEYRHVTHFKNKKDVNLNKPAIVFDIIKTNHKSAVSNLTNGRKFTPEQMREAIPPHRGLEEYWADMPFNFSHYIKEGEDYFSMDDVTSLFIYTGKDEKLIERIRQDFKKHSSGAAYNIFFRVVLWPNTTYKDYTSKDTTDEFGNLMDEL